MRSLLVGVLLICSTNVSGAANTSTRGTVWVKFLPIIQAHKLQGCQMAFLASTTNPTCAKNGISGVNGNIVVLASGTKAGLALNLALVNVNRGKQTTAEPVFSFIQTPNMSTINIQRQHASDNGGYRFVVYTNAYSEMNQLFRDMAKYRKVTIGYKRKEGGAEVRVPIDLTVVLSKSIPKDRKVVRTYSPAELKKFNACLQKVYWR